MGRKKKEPVAPDSAAAPKARESAETTIRVLRVTKPLMTGGDVAAAQTALTARGFHVGRDSDNRVFGHSTMQAVRFFQMSKSLPVTGRVDERTAAALGLG